VIIGVYKVTVNQVVCSAKSNNFIICKKQKLKKYIHMKKLKFELKKKLSTTGSFFFDVALCSNANDNGAQQKNAQSTTKFVHRGAGNPYLPLWEHLPDGEPRVFEDPDNPGKFRAYIIGSHDVRIWIAIAAPTSECGRLRLKT
jgi:hypothetical protein